MCPWFAKVKPGGMGGISVFERENDLGQYDFVNVENVAEFGEIRWDRLCRKHSLESGRSRGEVHMCPQPYGMVFQ